MGTIEIIAGIITACVVLFIPICFVLLYYEESQIYDTCKELTGHKNAYHINYHNEELGYEQGYGRCCYATLVNHEWQTSCGLYRIYG